MTKSLTFPYGISLAAGACAWIGISIVSGHSEAWDSSLYWIVGIPFLVLVTVGICYTYPNRAWRWPLMMAIGQAGIAFMTNPTGNLLPIGLITFLVVSVPLFVTAFIAAKFAGKRVDTIHNV